MCIVVARLIINKEDKGVQTFFVPIWDANHDPYLGVEVGDIGPKMGYNMKDNGFLRFDNYWIPWDYMLQRFTTLSKDGELKVKGNPWIMYAVMLKMRIIFLEEAYFFLSVGLTIGLRYSLVRTQFRDKEVGGEKVER